jgi:hypothetical protein
MADKTSFSTEEWASLRNTPQLMGLLMSISGASGLGTVKESFASVQGVMEGAQSDNAVLRSLATKDEVLAAQQFLKGQISLGQSPQEMTAKIRTLAFDNLGAAIAALKAKGTPADVSAYGAWITGIADKVANAAKEGGFLGIGGERVSAPEKALLEEIKAKLA